MFQIFYRHMRRHNLSVDKLLDKVQCAICQLRYLPYDDPERHFKKYHKGNRLFGHVIHIIKICFHKY